MESVTVKVTVKQTVSQERLEDLLCGAFEGGSNSWAVVSVTTNDMKAVGAEYCHEVATRGGEVTVFDAEEPDTKLGVLNAERIEKACVLMSSGKNEKGEDKPHYIEHWNDIIEENDDANTADLFFQLAVLGDIVYG